MIKMIKKHIALEVSLIDFEFRQYIVDLHAHNGGYRFVIDFPNKLRASIINCNGSYGLELAIIDLDNEMNYMKYFSDNYYSNFYNTYNWLKKEELNALLTNVMNYKRTNKIE